MSFTERHRHLLFVLGAAAFLWFAVWLFFLRDYAREAERLAQEFETGRAERERLCPADTGRPVALLLTGFDTANRGLDTAFAALKERLHFRFAEPILPESERGRPQMYARNRRDQLRDWLLREAETKRQIRVAPEAAGLGLVLPDELTETKEADEVWLRQMAVLQRAIELLLRISEEKDAQGERRRHLAAILAIRPLSPVRTGPAPAFLEEYPAEIEALLTLRGVTRLLALCSAPETFHVVQNLEVLARERESAPMRREDAGAKVIETWHDHFYRVRLRLAALTVVAEEKKKPEASGAPAGGVYVPIPH